MFYYIANSHFSPVLRHLYLDFLICVIFQTYVDPLRYLYSASC